MTSRSTRKLLLPFDQRIARKPLFYTDLRRLWALRTCYAALCLEHIYEWGKDGSRPYSPRHGRFLRFPVQQPHAD
jgi:hypothetical protein